MNGISRLKLFVLAAGDVCLMYAALVVMLGIRYGHAYFHELVRYHLLPFSLLFFAWTVLFYIGGMYDLKNLKNRFAFKRDFSFIMLVNLLVAVVFFYVFTAFHVSPKTNLLLLFVLFFAGDYAWRHLYNIILVTTMTPLNIAIIGAGREEEMLVKYITSNPQLGYRVGQTIDGIDKGFMDRLTGINLLVIPDYIKRDRNLIKVIYGTIFKGIDVKDISTFYEEIFNKIPLSELEESWFIENLSSQHSLFDAAKKPVEITLAALLMLVLLPAAVLIAAVIKLTSKGGAVFRQERVGRREKRFVLYKFRTMIHNAEAGGPKWAEEDDARVTPVGRVLRATHLDEIPQLVNVIKGDLSFVGPRPERPEFVEQLKKKIPYYEIRHIVKPGITGWAQINYKYAASINDTYEKLQFDLYYLKRRSLVLDILILLKTIKTFFINP